MRRLSFLFIFFLSLAVAFADADASFIASELIKQNLFKNQDKIQEISQNLTPDEKAALLAEHQKDPGGPIFVNLVIGFGIGSFIEGDPYAFRQYRSCISWPGVVLFWNDNGSRIKNLWCRPALYLRKKVQYNFKQIPRSIKLYFVQWEGL